MIVKNTITQQEIKEFFDFELNKLDKSLGLAIFYHDKKVVEFNDLALKILSMDGIKANSKYVLGHNELPGKLCNYILTLIDKDIKEDEEFLYDDTVNKEIVLKIEDQDDRILIHIISFELLLSTEKQLNHLNKILQATNNIFTASTWWKDYDYYSNYFYQSKNGAEVLGVEVSENNIYNVAEFQKVRDRAAKTSPYYDECIEEERQAFEKITKNQTDYFGGRTPAFDVNDEEIWVEAYGKCLLRYKDGRPRFFVAIDIYLSDLLEKSNQITVLNSLINQGLSNADVGIWYYQKHHKVGKYYFTDSHLRLMRLDNPLTNETATKRIDQHFEAIIKHSPQYEELLVDWRQTHNDVFFKGINSYKKVIPNNIDIDVPQWIEVRGSVLERDEDGDVKLFVGVNVDVTETVARNRELERLRQENERLQLAEKLAIKAGNVLVWYQDFDEDNYERYVYGNEMFTSRLGIKRSKEGHISVSSLRRTIVRKDEESRELAKAYIKEIKQIYSNKRDGVYDVLVLHQNLNTKEEIYIEHTIEIEERYPNGNVKIIGGFMRDVTENVERQKRIIYLANNDILTGLRNRNYFDSYINSNKLPNSYSVLLFDLDGLKLINDAFGHMHGDNAIKVVAKMLEQVFTDNIMIARIGGDEFLIISELTDGVEITRLANLIEDAVEQYNKTNTIEINISKGGYVVENNKVSFERAFTHAENLMYRRKLMNRSSRKSKVLDSLVETLHQKTEETQEHSERMSKYVIKISESLGIKRASDLEDLELLAKVHDIGKITIPDHILNKPGRLTDEEFEVVKKHAEAGYKIIKNITDSDFVCEAVLSHHERYDGTGYPQGLKGEEIPLFARIISVADAFDAMTNDRVYHKAVSEQEAIEELIKCSGSHFDPRIVQAFLKGYFNIQEK